jgi:hypothetical protein
LNDHAPLLHERKILAKHFLKGWDPVHGGRQ